MKDIVDLEIRPVAFVRLSGASYELMMDTDIFCPIHWEQDFYLGIGVMDAESFIERTDDLPPKARELLCRIVDEVKRRGFDRYLLISQE